MSSLINLEENEYVVTYFRKHWWRITMWAVGMLVLAFLPLFFIVMAISIMPGFSLPEYINTIGMFYSIWLTILWILFFIEWTDYYLDVWVLTNQRVVDIDHSGLFSRDVSTVRLDDIEDITTELHGILATVLRFGTITLQTAGSRDEFYLYNAANPEKIKEIIYKIASECKNHHNHDD